VTNFLYVHPTKRFDLVNSEASIAELTKFYNNRAPDYGVEKVKAFKDKATAARRVWNLVKEDSGKVPPAGKVADAAAAKGKKEEPAKAPAAAKTPATAPAAPTEAKKRGRQPGTGEFAGKVVFARKDVNPRRAGTAGFHSFEIIRGKKEGVSYADYISAGGRPNDLRWDIEHNWAEVK